MITSKFTYNVINTAQFINLDPINGLFISSLAIDNFNDSPVKFSTQLFQLSKFFHFNNSEAIMEHESQKS